MFWRFQILGWATFAILALPLKAVFYQSVEYAVLVTVFRESFGFLITAGLRHFYRLLGLRTDRPAHMAVLILAISFACSGLDLLLGLWIENIGDRVKNNDHVFGVFCFRALLFTVWSLLYFAIRDIMKARERLAGLQKAELAARDAEILMLRAQVSPHFLFNAFNTILAELDGKNPRMEPLVRGLSDYFRYSLASHDEVFVTMGQEYDAILSYLTVEKARFGDSLEIECHMDAEARDVPVPGIFLQPLVENALKYGHMTSPTPLRLRLHVFYVSGGEAVVEVTNSGEWVKEVDRPRNGAGGQGLSVLRRRLDLLYPGSHSMMIVPGEGEVTIRVRLPSLSQTPPDHDE